ncbi:MAG: hypothetical protein K9K35_10010 [Rhodoferax sp.]|nr:hypothetical protein [Rhodoferax sp.]
MTKNDLLALARGVNLHPTPDSYLEASVIEFARAVAAKEREACALLVDANAAACQDGMLLKALLESQAAAIRARGCTKEST